MDWLHTKWFLYVFLGGIIAVLDVFFAYRAAVAAYAFFSLLVGNEGAFIPAIIVFVGALGFGFAVTTHPTEVLTKKTGWIVAAVLLFDWTGAIYLAYNKTGWIDPMTSQGFIPFVGAIFLCVFVLFPFGGGIIMENLHTQLPTESTTLHNHTVTNFAFFMEKKAMKELRKNAQKDKGLLATFTPKALQMYKRYVHGEEEQPRVAGTTTVTGTLEAPVLLASEGVTTQEIPLDPITIQEDVQPPLSMRNEKRM